MDVYKRLEELGIKLPQAPPKAGLYSPAKEFGKGLIYISGCGPSIDGEVVEGKLGKDFTIEQGHEYAKKSMLNVLAVLEANIGDLNKVKTAVKIIAFVASADDFYSQPQVANGGSQLLLDIFGEQVGASSRSAVGVNALPGNIPVEIEALFEIETK